MPVKKQRQLNYELLRAIAMVMVVCLHYLGKGGLLGDPARADMTAAGYAAWLIEAFCLVAVNVYVLISGYFGAGAAKRMEKCRMDQRLADQGFPFREVLRRPFQIWKLVFFYSMAIGCGTLLAGMAQFDIYRFFSYCFPIVTEHYWFATSYLFLCLLMPLLNAGIAHIGQKEFRCLLAGLLLVLCVSKTVIPMELPRDRYGYDDVWFVALYLTGAYLGRYGIPALRRRRRAAALYFASVGAVFSSFLALRAVFLRTGAFGEMIQYSYAYNHLFCYTGAVGLFLAFAQDKETPALERFRKPIEFFSASSFGVYLIHEHVDIRYRWPEWFGCGPQAEGPVAGLVLHMAGTVLAVYLACTLIETARRKLSEGIAGIVRGFGGKGRR